MLIDSLLTKAAGEVFPGATCSVFNTEEVLFEMSVGHFTLAKSASPISPYSIFDIASLTKVIATVSVCMKAIELGLLDLDDKLAKYFPEADTDILVKHLLSHSAGFQPVLEISELCSVESATNLILASELSYRPGTKSVYSDCGFIVFGFLLEKVFQKSLLDLTEEYVLEPLGMTSTSWGATTTAVPTSNCSAGEVNDPVARNLNSAAGHAGLFSNIKDVTLFSSEILKSYYGRSKFFDQDILKFFWKNKIVPNSSWALGWDTPSPENSSAGKLFGASSVGHLAYTGCSIWLELEKRFGVVVLSNRVWPDDKNFNIKTFRPVLHEAAWKQVVG